MRPDELDRLQRARLDALGPAPRAELLHVLMLPDLERADRIGEFWGDPESRAFAELLILRGGPDASGGARRDAARGRERSRYPLDWAVLFFWHGAVRLVRGPGHHTATTSDRTELAEGPLRPGGNGDRDRPPACGRGRYPVTDAP
jgi:hypothetical protein